MEQEEEPRTFFYLLTPLPPKAKEKIRKRKLLGVELSNSL